LIHALASSGGKDSTLALDRARRDGRDVRYLVNLFDAPTERVKFHGIHRDLIELQARALALDPILRQVVPGTFEDVFMSALAELRELGVGALTFGNIHLADVRAWYEERVIAAGLEHVEPLWGDDPAAVTRETIARGYRTRIVSVDLAAAPRSWLGRELTGDLAAEIIATGSVDPAGERGEFHTYVFDGPLFSAPIEHRLGEVRETETHALVDLVAAG
jgi:uncharacterized protein (TIGR00290 family)